jgi:uncharacterized protein (DUF362 family)
MFEQFVSIECGKILLPCVALVKGPREHETVYKALDLLDGLKNVVAESSRVLIKVNFISVKTYETGVTTDPLVVEAIIRRIKKLSDEVFVVESDASMTDADKACKATGMLEVCNDNRVKFVNLHREKDRVKLKIPDAETLKEITVPKIFVGSAIISAAKLKTHSEAGVSLGMKNMFGLLPNKLKFRYHLKGISKVIVDINTVLKSRLTVIDGFYALEGPGPTTGTPVKMDLIIAGKDPVATDATSCRVIGINPEEIYHIRRAYEKGFGEIDETKIELVGNKLKDVMKKFRRT